MVWVLLLASAAAVLLTGLVATALIVYQLPPRPAAPPSDFSLRLLLACGLTFVSLVLRALRWIYLLRRSETRIPIRDAYIGYFAGLSLLLAPFLLGEILVRGYVHRARGRVPTATIAIVNVWERLLDVAAIAALVAAAAALSGRLTAWPLAAGVAFAVTLLPLVRAAALRGVTALVRPLARLEGRPAPVMFSRLASGGTWATALATSVVIWLLPGLGFWALGNAWGPALGALDAQLAYSSSTLLGAVTLAPAGVLVAGGRLLAVLEAAGVSVTGAVLSVLGIRLATAGFSTILGGVFLAIHFGMRQPGSGASDAHFDEIADSYDVQIPESRRLALLTRKTELMRDILAARGAGPRGLDVGCGQGWYVARMRALGFDVAGIDSSAGQVALAARHVGQPGVITRGSAIGIPAADGTYDFAYVINVLHHLASVEEQQAAFTEMFRVLKPGGLLFVHEINTRNIFFRFYMGYVFPSLNCIDEGVERWLLPQRLSDYTPALVTETRYFTFFPDFIPQSIATLMGPLERALEHSPAGRYSAHYMAVLQKPLS